MAEANLYRFSSKEDHGNSGLIYFGSRFYEPNLQRWVSRDPLEEAGGINLYAFTGNSPVNTVDPWGNQPEDEDENYSPNYVNALGNYTVQEGYQRGAANLNNADQDTFPRFDVTLFARQPSQPIPEQLPVPQLLPEGIHFVLTGATLGSVGGSGGLPSVRLPALRAPEAVLRAPEANPFSYNELLVPPHFVGTPIGPAMAARNIDDIAMAAIPNLRILSFLRRVPLIRGLMPAAKGSLSAARDAIGLSNKIRASGMTPDQARQFFGWGSGANITKPLAAFSRASLEAAGWTKARLSEVAKAYREIAKITPDNPAAPVRAQQLESLLKLFE